MCNASKHILILLAILTFPNNLFSMSPRREFLVLRNFSGNNVTVNMIFSQGPGTSIDSNIAWHQNVSDITLSIRSNLLLVGSNEIWPGESVQIISYFPLGPQLEEKYYRLFAMPFIEKIREIFNVFEIIVQNRVFITLSNIEEWVIHEWDGVYVLEIFDENSREKVYNRRASLDWVSITETDDLSQTDNFLESLIIWSVAMSLTNGRIFLPEMVPGYSHEERQALLMHQIHHQGTYQNFNTQEVFQQLLREAALHHFEGIDIFETRNYPFWYLEYDAQRFEDRSLVFSRNEFRTGTR